MTRVERMCFKKIEHATEASCLNQSSRGRPRRKSPKSRRRQQGEWLKPRWGKNVRAALHVVQLRRAQETCHLHARGKSPSCSLSTAATGYAAHASHCTWCGARKRDPACALRSMGGSQRQCRRSSHRLQIFLGRRWRRTSTSAAASRCPALL